MGQRPFAELPPHKRLAMLFRDTRRIRWLVEQQMGPIRDDEWLKVVTTLTEYSAKRVRTLRSTFPWE